MQFAIEKLKVKNIGTGKRFQSSLSQCPSLMGSEKHMSGLLLYIIRQ